MHRTIVCHAYFLRNIPSCKMRYGAVCNLAHHKAAKLHLAAPKSAQPKQVNASRHDYRAETHYLEAVSVIPLPFDKPGIDMPRQPHSSRQGPPVDSFSHDWFTIGLTAHELLLRAVKEWNGISCVRVRRVTMTVHCHLAVQVRGHVSRN